MANTFDWIEIKTKDMEKTIKFYEEVFGWKIVAKEKAEGTDYYLFDTGDMPRLNNLQRGAFWLRHKDGSPGVIVYILVDDIDAIVEKIKNHEGKVVTHKSTVGTNLIATFADPSGNILGLWEEKTLA